MARRGCRSAEEGVTRFANDATTDVSSDVEIKTAAIANDGRRTMQLRLSFLYYA